MIYLIEITKQAEADLRGIFEYIAFELISPENASNQLDRLEESIMKLKRMPERFKVYEIEPWYNRGLRQMIVDNYVVFYIPDSQRGIVTIIRIIYVGRNIDRELQKHIKI